MTTVNDDWMAFGSLHFHLFKDLVESDDTEERNKAPLQLGVLRARGEHEIRTNPNPTRAEDALAKGKLHTVNTWINLAVNQGELRHVLEGVAWGEQNPT